MINQYWNQSLKFWLIFYSIQQSKQKVQTLLIPKLEGAKYHRFEKPINNFVLLQVKDLQVKLDEAESQAIKGRRKVRK